MAHQKNCNGDEQMGQSGHHKGAEKWPTKSFKWGNKNRKHKYSSEEGKFCELHHVMDHDDDTGDCEVLKTQAGKMHANWETHRSKYKHNNKHNHNNNNNSNSKKSKTQENQCSEDDNFDNCVWRTVSELLSHNPKNKQQKNENWNVEEFKKFNLSNDDSDSKEEGKTSLWSSKWCCQEGENGLGFLVLSLKA